MRHWLFPVYQADSAAPAATLTGALKDSARAKAPSRRRKIDLLTVKDDLLTAKIDPSTIKIDPSTAKTGL